MSRPSLSLVQQVKVVHAPVPFSVMLADHRAILQGYLDTHVTRNHSARTLEGDRRFLLGWFESFMVEDESHPDGERQLLIWEAMEPVVGRQRIVGFSKGLVTAGLRPRTVTGYLGCLRRCFEYVLASPYVPGAELQSITMKYGRIEQPILEYDYPVHVLDHEQEGIVLTGQRLLAFYDFVRLEYIGRNQKKMPASRDYTMLVLAGETGLRADEIRHLDAGGPHRDLFYEEGRIQTRSGKGCKGSGKRVLVDALAAGRPHDGSVIDGGDSARPRTWVRLLPMWPAPSASLQTGRLQSAAGSTRSRGYGTHLRGKQSR